MVSLMYLFLMVVVVVASPVICSSGRLIGNAWQATTGLFVLST